jgi:hypothetical protein
MESWIGKSVEVQFRRDALGAGALLPISPTTNSAGGAQVSVTGTLLEALPDSIVVEMQKIIDGALFGDPRPHWIPREVILMVRGPNARSLN